MRDGSRGLSADVMHELSHADRPATPSVRFRPNREISPRNQRRVRTTRNAANRTNGKTAVSQFDFPTSSRRTLRESIHFAVSAGGSYFPATYTRKFRTDQGSGGSGVSGWL